MENRKSGEPSEARGSIKEAIGKVTGDAYAEAKGAAEVKAARKRNCETSHPRDDQEELRAGISNRGMHSVRNR